MVTRVATVTLLPGCTAHISRVFLFHLNKISKSPALLLSKVQHTHLAVSLSFLQESASLEWHSYALCACCPGSEEGLDASTAVLKQLCVCGGARGGGGVVGAVDVLPV